MSTIKLSIPELESTLNTNDIVLIDFWAQWCGPCRMFGPIFEKVSEKYPDIAFAKVDTEKDHDLAAAFGIQSIPTLAIFRDKILLYKQPGALPENALIDLIKHVKELDMEKIKQEIKTKSGTAVEA